MRRRAPRPVSVSLERTLDLLAPQTLLAEVQRAWPAVAGPAFEGASAPVAEHGGVVRVACASAVWAQELDLMSERVVGALNEHLGRTAVKRLRCEVSTRRQ